MPGSRGSPLCLSTARGTEKRLRNYLIASGVLALQVIKTRFGAVHDEPPVEQ